MLHNSTPPLPILYLSSRKHLHQRCEVRSCINMAQTGNLSKHDFFFFKDTNNLNFTWISPEPAVLINCSLLHTATGEVSLCYYELVLKLVWADSTKQRQWMPTPALLGHSCCPGKSSDLFSLMIWTQTNFFSPLLKKAAKAASLCRCLKVLLQNSMGYIYCCGFC